MILIYIVGACISYEIIITSLFKYVCHTFGMSDEMTDNTKATPLSYYQAIPTSAFILFPLCLKKDMSAFRYISIASIVALIYTGIVLLAELPAYYKEFKPTADIKPIYVDLNLFTGCSMTFFAYTCQIQLLPIYSELVDPSYRRIKKVINRSITVDVLFYFIIACAGFFSMF